MVGREDRERVAELFIRKAAGVPKVRGFGEYLKALLAGGAVKGAPGAGRIARRMGRGGVLAAMWRHHPVPTAAAGLGTGFLGGKLLSSRKQRDVNVTKI